MKRTHLTQVHVGKYVITNGDETVEANREHVIAKKRNHKCEVNCNAAAKIKIERKT